MTRDYKRRSSRKKKNTSPPWMWMVAGFALGLIAAFMMYLKYEQPQRSVDSPVPDAEPMPQSIRDSGQLAGVADQASPGGQSDSGEPLPAQGDRDFDFYEVLPSFEVAIPEENEPPVRSGTKPATTRTAVKPAAPGTYILQAGSFRKFADADRRKAELAFKGIESNIQQVVLKTDQIWYRVYIGPTKDVSMLENTRSALRRDNIDALLLKQRN